MIVDLLHLLARANLAGGLAILVIVLLRWQVRSAFGASAAYGLWAIPLVVALAALFPIPRGGPIAPMILAAAGSLPAVPSFTRGSVWPVMVVGGWALGALLYVAMLGTEQLRFASALRRGTRATVGGRSVVRAAGTDIGPAVVGRTIVLPIDFEARFTATEQAAIIAHEARHLARGDVIANAVLALIQCLCWFNPLVHLAARWMRADQELACDAEVIADRPGLKRAYAEALLKTQTVVSAPPVGCGWRPRGFRALRDRILLMKQRAPSASRRACGGLFIAFLTLIGGYAAWATQPSSQASTVMDPDWSSRPDGADLARLYPAKAQAERLEGMAVIECYVERSGALSGCTILRETPEAAGFGDATLQMAPLFQMKPKSKSGKPVAGGVVRIPVKFMVPATGGQS